jgi:hypothetical protein
LSVKYLFIRIGKNNLTTFFVVSVKYLFIRIGKNKYLTTDSRKQSYSRIIPVWDHKQYYDGFFFIAKGTFGLAKGTFGLEIRESTLKSIMESIMESISLNNHTLE